MPVTDWGSSRRSGRSTSSRRRTAVARWSSTIRATRSACTASTLPRAASVRPSTPAPRDRRDHSRRPDCEASTAGTIASAAGGATSRTRRMPSRLLRTAAAARGRSPTQSSASSPVARLRSTAMRTSSGVSSTSTTSHCVASRSVEATSAAPSDAIVRRERGRESRRTARPHHRSECTYGIHTVRSSPRSSTEASSVCPTNHADADGRHTDDRRSTIASVSTVTGERAGREDDRAQAPLHPRDREVRGGDRVRDRRQREQLQQVRRVVRYAGPYTRRMNGAPSAITIASGATMRSDGAIMLARVLDDPLGLARRLGDERHPHRDRREVQRVGDRPRLVEVRAGASAEDRRA